MHTQQIIQERHDKLRAKLISIDNSITGLAKSRARVLAELSKIELALGTPSAALTVVGNLQTLIDALPGAKPQRKPPLPPKK